MARPKKGSKGHAEATRKWHETMEKKYGSVHEYMKKCGSAGGKAGCGPNYRGGFAKSHEWASACGKVGGKVSTRKGVKNGQSRANNTEQVENPEPKKKFFNKLFGRK